MQRVKVLRPTIYRAQKDEWLTDGDEAIMSDSEVKFLNSGDTPQVSRIEFVDPAEMDDSDAEADSAPDTGGVTDAEFDLPDESSKFVDRDVEAVEADVLSGDYDDYLESLWEAETADRDRVTVKDALRERGYSPPEDSDTADETTEE